MRTVAPLGFALAIVLGSVACSDAKIRCIALECQETTPTALDNKLTFEGNACTANPNSVGYPYKVLFVVDVSGSTSQSDPTNNRGPAVQAVLNQYANNSEVYFAIISFDTQPNLLETTFTRDQALLQSVVPQLNSNLGSTNYLDTLAAVKNIISADANNMTEAERARTRYDIQWLSDGVPNPCINVAQIEQQEQPILDLVKTYGLFDVRLSTIYLTGANADQCNGQSPNDIMPPMAQLGRGSYQALTGANIKFNIAFSEILQPFNNQRFYLVNESRVVRNGQLLPDSDRDGVADADEIAQGTDPTIADTTHSGCGDRTVNLEAVNPNLCVSVCNQAMVQGNITDPNKLTDTDSDGLLDCEELSLGISRGKADSDGDNLIDPLEIRFGTNANDPATLTADSDLDGVKDVDEVLTGTDPFSQEGGVDLAYKYTPLSSVAGAQRGVTCFNYTVDNVRLVQTIATPTSAAGDNYICAYVEQLPQGDSSSSSEVTVSRACFTANYKVVGGAEFKIPSNGPVNFSQLDFKPFICGSAPCNP